LVRYGKTPPQPNHSSFCGPRIGIAP
jgi:hypothetical protein